jgi:prolyl-tRNA editing enzyme YbaK/EbsC (Cys-tRNA(Pro) deacylase)
MDGGAPARGERTRTHHIDAAQEKHMAQTGSGGKRNSLERVTAYLAEHGLADRVVTFEGSTRTAQLAAEAVDCELGQIVKSLVFVGDDGVAVLALVAGDRRGDADAIAREAGMGGVRFADADTVRSATGYAIGGVSPFDLPGGLAVLVDDSLARFAEVYTAGGTPDSMVRLTIDQLMAVSHGRMARISQD